MKGKRDGGGGVRKPKEKEDRKQCVYQQTFGCCQLTAKAERRQRKEKEVI